MTDVLQQPPASEPPPTSTEGTPIPAPPPTAPQQLAAHHLDAGHHHGYAQLPPLKFLDELKRRNVGRVAILYIVVSYVVLEVFEMFFHLLEMPPWTGRAAVLIAVLGFPIALLIAWAYEVTPEGLKPTDEVPIKQSIRHQTGKRLDRAIIVVLAIALTYFVLDKFWLSKHAATGEGAAAEQPSTAATPTVAISDKSIAVLPFVDMSEKHDQEYFGDGMAEEILDLLTKIPGLTVIGRTSSFQFKGKNADLRTIGTQLNAAYVLEGSVRNSGSQVRITAQLINTRTGAHEWSDSYDRPIGDVLKLQDSIAAAVVRELQLTVAPGYLGSRSTVKDFEAYDLMLRGRQAADRYDSAGLAEAVSLFQRALEHDPTSADAAAALAYAYEKSGVFNYLSDAAAFEPARRAADAALRLDPKNALAHLVLGRIYMIHEFDWAAADREFQTAAALAPGSAPVLNGKARLSLVLGRWEEALVQIRAALAIDPLDPRCFEALSAIQAARGRYDEAEAALRRALEIRPSYASGGRWLLGHLQLARGDNAALLAEMQEYSKQEHSNDVLALAYFAVGRRADADAALSAFLKEGSDAYYVAQVYAFRGELDEAMRWLERAREQRNHDLPYLKSDATLRKLAPDPRFKAFLRKMNLPE